jgi:hypothetical protein
VSDDCEFRCQLAFVPAAPYTLAFTCAAGDEDAAPTVTAGQTITVTLVQTP